MEDRQYRRLIGAVANDLDRHTRNVSRHLGGVRLSVRCLHAKRAESRPAALRSGRGDHSRSPRRLRRKTNGTDARNARVGREIASRPERFALDHHDEPRRLSRANRQPHRAGREGTVTDCVALCEFILRGFIARIRW